MVVWHGLFLDVVRSHLVRNDKEVNPMSCIIAQSQTSWPLTIQGTSNGS
jgi:hypothetical protein